MKNKSSLEKGVEIIQSYVKTLSSAPGVYRMLDDQCAVLYVGKAKNLKKRVVSYTRPEKQTIRIQRMISLTRTMEFVTTHTEGEALLLEANLIKSLTPRYNVLFRDDKSFPYILLTRGELPPALTLHRGAKTEAGDYFGPFASTQAARKTLEILSRVFKLRTCTSSVYKNRTRPCLQYYIKRCTAPCVAKVSAVDYEQQVENARQFLLGKTHTLQKRLAQQMEEASAARFYERAAHLRDQIQALTKTQEEQGVYLKGAENLDVIALVRLHGKAAVQIFFFRHGSNYGSRSYFPKYDPADTDEEILEAFVSWFYAGAAVPKQVLLNKALPEQETLEKMLSEQAGYAVTLEVPQQGKRFQLIQQAEKNAKEVLASKLVETASSKKIWQEVARLFALPTLPKRIEVYDNSHNQGREAYGVMIVATPEGFDKKAYRTFGIKNVTAHEHGGDDYAMMREVLNRRFQKAEPAQFPDLVLLDGGQGQLSAGLQVMQELGVMHIPIAAIAKGPDRNAGREKFFLPNQAPFSLEPTDPVLYYLQRLRDEAHRFAIGAHRQKKQKAVTGSQLDDIKGIGAQRKKDLLQHFGSVKAISGAGVADLKKVTGISQAIAQTIYDFFH
ncbi:MAG: excinuclease ABC subunit C [Alphaproteobacteria bacterium RIFCSPHIGHO2_01_FULL_41_14]|nr:MAG: excinuclease ABC subunit C [Alphaproteobacteria bacterium GWB1_45_5]OFW90055.1 MAG: excinuclease ABC subunit C [Alphaproteobacteria bacterium RIFCSPHIGHO2_01_FULL_41_14]HCI48571.1 excinuclease ABC subunit C [Holosporales bacterium]